MKVETLHTERLTLRPNELADIESWQKWDTDPDVQEYLPEPLNEPTTVEEQERYLEECLMEDDAAYWSIVYTETSTLIGTISLHEINAHHGVAELSIVIGEKDYWGKGIASESIRAILAYAKDAMGLRRIVAEFEADNLGIAKALEANGFNEEAVIKASRIKRGSPINTLRYYILL